MVQLFMLGWMEVGLILMTVVFLFGGKKIPQLMRGLGQGLSEFKSATNEITESKQELEKSARSLRRKIRL